MTEDLSNFEVLSADQVRRRYRLTGVRAQEVDFDERDVPKSLRHLIPLARVWGIGDDVLREDLQDAADPTALRELKALVTAANDDLDEWLTSPKAISSGPSKAYLAFTNLRMVADSVPAK